jgi:hypothetical protein
MLPDEGGVLWPFVAYIISHFHVQEKITLRLSKKKNL